MKTALIIGGTGLVGKKLTVLLLEDKRYSSIILLVRKPLSLVHEKLVQVIFDFDNPDPSLVSGDELYCCMGSTIKAAGSKAAFYKIDHDYIIEIARIALQNGIKNFALISAMGANKNSAIFYNKTKGETEKDILQLGFETVYIFQPSLLLGQRPVARTGEMIASVLMKNLTFLIPKKYRPIHDHQVAKSMIDHMNAGKTGAHIVDSGSMQAK